MNTVFYEWMMELNSGDVGNIISAFAAISAIVGLICQSHSTRKQVKLQNFIEYTKRYQEIILNFPESINEQSFSFETLLQEDKNKTMRYMRAYFDLCFEEFTLHEKKYIDNDLWSIWRGGMMAAFSKSAFKQAWMTIKTDTEFDASFKTFVEHPEKPRSCRRCRC